MCRMQCYSLTAVMTKQPHAKLMKTAKWDAGVKFQTLESRKVKLLLFVALVRIF